MKQSAQPSLPFPPNPDAIVDIPVALLRLDTENPRLAIHSEAYDEEALVRTLWTEMSVDEVAFSIAANGFFRSEPLFVVPNPKSIQYSVIEGNRRLAAVLLLRDPKLRDRIGASDLPPVTQSQLQQLQVLPSIVFPDRRSLWTTVGFRHINGIKPWDSFSKARYIAQVHENYNTPLDEIARRIGDRHSTVVRLYRGIKILQQAETHTPFRVEDRSRGKFYFSHLYTAVDQKEYQDFIGIRPERSLKPNPVPKSKLPELQELMTYIYGSKASGKPPLVQTQNPDLNTLREVLSSDKALSALRRGYPLDRAHQVAIGDPRRFRDALVSSKVELQNAKATVTTGFRGERDLLETMADILSLAQSINDEMKARAR